MPRPAPAQAKENDLPPRPAEPIQKKAKARQSLKGDKRVSFGHVELHTFLKDADRTPSPMLPPPSASPRDVAPVEGHAVAAALHAAAPAQAFAPTAHTVPQLADLLRDDDATAAKGVDDDDDDDVVFQPRGAGDNVTMEFTQSYGRGILGVNPAQSPLQEPTVTMDFTRSYGKGILSGGGGADQDDVDRMDEDEPEATEAVGPLVGPSYDQYLAAHDVHFTDAGGPRDSLVPDAVDELAQFGGADSREEALIIAAACIRHGLESAQWGAEQLAGSCAQIRAAIVQTEELVLTGAGDFFANLAASSDELRSLKALCRHGALAMWHEWHSKLEASNAKVLAEAESHLLADRAKLDDLLGTLRDAHAAATAAEPATAIAGRAAESERALGHARAEIGQQEAAIAEAARRTASAREAMAALRAQLDALATDGTGESLEAEHGQLGARAAELRASHDQLLAADVGSAVVASDPAAAARARAQETALLTACLGWRALTLTSSLIELSFDGGVTLRAALAPAADKSLRLRSAPTLERQPRAAGDDAIGAMLIDLALTEVARDAAACVGLSALPALVLRLSTLCGRALDLQREVEALSAPYRIVCTREPVIVGGRPASAPVLNVTFSLAEQRLRFCAMIRIDSLAMPPALSYQQIEVDVCPSGVSHGSIANCVVGAMAATEQVAQLRLNAICANVVEAAAKVCGALPA